MIWLLRLRIFGIKECEAKSLSILYIRLSSEKLGNMITQCQQVQMAPLVLEVIQCILTALKSTYVRNLSQIPARLLFFL